MAHREKTASPSAARSRGYVFARVMRGLCIALAGVFLLLTLLSAFFLVADSVAEYSARTVPSYPKEDLTSVIQNTDWSEEDYALIYRQTGLTKSGADAMKNLTPFFTDFQNALFFRGEIRHLMAASSTAHDYLADPETGIAFCAPIVPLEAGDVIVTSSCHTFGWRNGHAAIVLNRSGAVLESVTIGCDSEVTYGGDLWFRESANFMVLRLKGATAEERAAIAADAEERLIGIPYSIFVGIFGKKDQCADGAAASVTHCSHLVWQAFKNFGYDIDADGGPVCTTRDIAASPCFEVLQVYGFDLDKLW